MIRVEAGLDDASVRTSRTTATWDGEVCKNCGENSHVGFGVPDDVWDAVTIEGQGHVWCVGCFTREAEERGIVWVDAITFYPASSLVRAEKTLAAPLCETCWGDRFICPEDASGHTHPSERHDRNKYPCPACNVVREGPTDDQDERIHAQTRGGS